MRRGFTVYIRKSISSVTAEVGHIRIIVSLGPSNENVAESSNDPIEVYMMSIELGVIQK